MCVEMMLKVNWEEERGHKCVQPFNSEYLNLIKFSKIVDHGLLVLYKMVVLQV